MSPTCLINKCYTSSNHRLKTAPKAHRDSNYMEHKNNTFWAGIHLVTLPYSSFFTKFKICLHKAIRYYSIYNIRRFRHAAKELAWWSFLRVCCRSLSKYKGSVVHTHAAVKSVCTLMTALVPHLGQSCTVAPTFCTHPLWVAVETSSLHTRSRPWLTCLCGRRRSGLWASSIFRPRTTGGSVTR